MTQDQLKALLVAAFDDDKDRELAFKSMFGIVCAYVNGRVFAWLSNRGMALKIDSPTSKTWIEGGGKLLQFDEEGPIFKSYVVVPEVVLRDEEELARWVQRSVRFVLTLSPPKMRKRKKIA